MIDKTSPHYIIHCNIQGKPLLNILFRTHNCAQHLFRPCIIWLGWLLKQLSHMPGGGMCCPSTNSQQWLRKCEGKRRWMSTKICNADTYTSSPDQTEPSSPAPSQQVGDQHNRMRCPHLSVGQSGRQSIDRETQTERRRERERGGGVGVTFDLPSW